MNAKKRQNEIATEEVEVESGESSRLGRKSESSVRNYSVLLEELSGEMKALADDMKKNGIESLRLDGKTKPDRGIKLLKEFILNFEGLISDEKRRRAMKEFENKIKQVTP